MLFYDESGDFINTVPLYRHTEHVALAMTKSIGTPPAPERRFVIRFDSSPQPNGVVDYTPPTTVTIQNDA